MLFNSISRLRIAGLLEGSSYLILLFIAVPLKYMADQPHGVEVTGPLHGLFFLLYCAFIMEVHFSQEWTFKRSGIAFLAAFVPFGTFVLDRQLKIDEKLVEDD